MKFLQRAHCHACNSIIPDGYIFCKICKRDRFIRIQQWEFLIISLLLIMFIASFSFLRIFLIKDSKFIALTQQITNPVPTLIEPTLFFAPTNTPSVLKTTPSNTPLPLITSCSGAPPQRVEVGRRGFVCTQYDRLIVRTGPYASDTEITRIEPNTYFRVIDGPVCANNWSWWEIRTDDGVRGWVSEGGDNVDKYFICPQNLSP
ncbi:MAG: SH3 type 3 domain-containing protein [Chloroflexi bacterium OLB14]|nr:MAG: SH3 type 3 domain-containing protein [Chloroflexi bacterium OLB14]